MAEKISAVYIIVNTITGDSYIGSSKNVKSRWKDHKCPSTWKKHPNNPMYLDMRKYGLDKFEFQILAEVEEGKLKETEQQFIETLKPTYNNRRANGWDIERYKNEYSKEYHRKYYQRNRKKVKEYHRKYYQRNRKKVREYQKEYQKEYYQNNRESKKEYQKEYNSQLCSYNGEVLKLCALSKRFQRAGVEHPTAEAKKYLLKESKNAIEFYDVYP